MLFLHKITKLTSPEKNKNKKDFNYVLTKFTRLTYQIKNDELRHIIYMAKPSKWWGTWICQITGLAESIGSKSYRASNSPSNPALHQPFQVALLYICNYRNPNSKSSPYFTLRPSVKKERQSQIIEIASSYFEMTNLS